MSYDDPPTPSSYMFMALEDTFRIPSVSPSSRRRRSRRTTPESYEDDEDLVVIPPMGDRDVENDVQVLLAGHGFRTRHSTDGMDFYTAEDAMAVDELESEHDCVSSHTPSRSSSPSPSVHIGGARHSFSPPARTIARTSPPIKQEENTMDDGLDIAGICFDPAGAHVYVATTESVAEWGISGSEKRWWFDDGWA